MKWRGRWCLVVGVWNLSLSLYIYIICMFFSRSPFMTYRVRILAALKIDPQTVHPKGADKRKQCASECGTRPKINPFLGGTACGSISKAAEILCLEVMSGERFISNFAGQASATNIFSLSKQHTWVGSIGRKAVTIVHALIRLTPVDQILVAMANGPWIPFAWAMNSGPYPSQCLSTGACVCGHWIRCAQST